MLWSRDDDLVCITIADCEHPCPATLADDRAGLPVEAAVGHAFLDARLDYNMYAIADLEMLDYGGYWRKPALP